MGKILEKIKKYKIKLSWDFLEKNFLSGLRQSPLTALSPPLPYIAPPLAIDALKRLKIRVKIFYF